MPEKKSELNYKGYRGSVEGGPAHLHGKILDISDLVTYGGLSEEDLEMVFQDSVEDYISTCREVGKNPCYNPKVFLGGTCNGSNWRDRIIPQLKVPYFNPVVEDWTMECQAEEERQKKLCPVHLYVITPLMKGVFSIAEAVDDSNNMPVGTIFVPLEKDEGTEFDKGEWKSIQAVARLIDHNGGLVFYSLGETVEFLNNMTEYYRYPLFMEQVNKEVKSQGEQNG